MKKIVALLCVSVCLTSMAGVSSLDRASVLAATRVVNHHEMKPTATPGKLGVSNSDMLGTRICMLHVYDWNELTGGTVEVTEADPLYNGGWNTTIVNGAQQGYLTLEGGFTTIGISQPVKVDYAAGKVTLEAGDEPFAVVTGTTTIEGGAITTTIDSTTCYYIVNEDWLVNYGELADVQGEILADGSIHIADGFAIYVETTTVTTITGKGSQSTQYTDVTREVSQLFRDTWLLKPNGKHEFVRQSDGVTCVVDVYLTQPSKDMVYVTNLYGFGGPQCYMQLATDGTMTYPEQPLRDIVDSTAPGGDGMWYNATLNGSALIPGNVGNVTPQAITWGLTTPTDHNTTWQGWRNNKLYYTDGSQFEIPVAFIRGDVDNDGEVAISDVSVLIDALLSGNISDSAFFNALAADCDQDGEIGISDASVLIDFLLTGVWM